MCLAAVCVSRGAGAAKEHALDFLSQRPFPAVPNRQLMLAADSQWFDFELIGGLAGESAD